MWKIIIGLILFIGWIGCLFEYFSIDSLEDYLHLILGTGIGFLISGFIWINKSQKY